MRMTAVSEYWPWPSTGGATVNLANFLRHGLLSGSIDWRLYGVGELPGDPPAPIGRDRLRAAPTRGGRLAVLREVGAGRIPSCAAFDFRALARELAESWQESDVLHVHLYSALPLVEELERLVGKVRSVASISDSASLAQRRRNLRGRLARRAAARMEARYLPQYGTTLVVSERDRRWLRDRVPDVRAVHWPLGVDCQAFPQRVERPDRSVDVLFVGALRGIFATWLDPFLEQTLPQLRTAHPRLRMTVVGGAWDERTAAMLRRHGIRTLGFVDDLAALYSRSRVVLAPHPQPAGVPNKALEGMAAGVPVVGPSDVLCRIQGARTWTSFAPGDTPRQMADSIDRLLADEDLNETVGEEGRRCVRAHHDWPMLVRRYLDVVGREPVRHPELTAGSV